ncbi:MAG: hypothetical protein JNM69_14260 [Archangium sp.]|nr:hypothetical protein [Archangium sp.]
MRAFLGVLVAGLVVTACCIQPTPMPTPRPTMVTGVPIPSGTPSWAGDSLLIGTTGYDSVGEFRPLMNDFTLATGLQGGGGRHVFVSFRVKGQTAGELTMTTRVTRASDGALVGAGVQPVTFSASDAGFDSNYSPRVVLCPTPAGLSIVGQSLKFESWAQASENGPVLGYATVTAVPLCSGDCQNDCGG